MLVTFPSLALLSSPFDYFDYHTFPPNSSVAVVLVPRCTHTPATRAQNTLFLSK